MPEPGEALSEREMEVLRLAARGLTNDQIAAQLVISTNTVKAHLRNIFAKLAVASRTEAALLAIQRGWVTVETPATAASEPVAIEEPSPAAAPLPAPTAEVVPTPQPALPWPRWLILAAMLVLIVALILSMFGLPQGLFLRQTNSPLDISPEPRWATLADLPTARSDLVLVPFADSLYAIGGVGAEGVSPATERFDSLGGTWVGLAPKPTAVSEARGAVLGGHIYIPGGRDAQGQPLPTTEVYLVERDQWASAAALPRPLSGYALTSFEGKLYLFGGWDGLQYRAEILRYDPGLDRWEEIGRLPFPWGYAGAVAIGSRILLIGGINADGPLNVTLDYSPALVTVQYTQPLSGVSLGRAQATVLLDRYLYILADPGNGQPPRILQWELRTRNWQEIEPSPAGLYPGTALAGMGTEIFVVGGRREGAALPLVQRFQAIYIVTLPTPAP